MWWCLGNADRPRSRPVRHGVLPNRRRAGAGVDLDVGGQTNRPNLRAAPRHLFDGSARGGHLLGTEMWSTLEVVLTGAPARLRKMHADGPSLIGQDRPQE